MSADNQVINLAYLESIADGDDEIVIELINIFLDQIDEFTEGLDSFFREKNWRGVAALAHKAKSSVVSMGMDELGNKDLKNLELIAKFFTIEELHNRNKLDVKEQNELDLLKKSLGNYTEGRQTWVVENATENTVSSIINKFKDICQRAGNELRVFLESR